MTDKQKTANDAAKEQARLVAEAEEAAEANETDAGGRYLVNGQLVDANGKPVKG